MGRGGDVTWPKLSKQQEAQLKKFLRYLAESDADWILEAGGVYPTFQHDRERIRDVACIHLEKSRRKSGLTYKSAEGFARTLGESLMATAKAAHDAPGEYDWHIIHEIDELNKLGWGIMYYNDGGCS